MKTALLLIATCTAIAASAQTPVNRAQAIVQKATATWCGPCGTWGWTTHEGILDDNMVGLAPHAMVLASHGSLGVFHTGTADSMSRNWIGSAIPEWGVNNVKRPSSRIEIKKSVDSFVAKAPTASTAFSYTIAGNKITFNTKTKFWKAANGTYALGVYILEDSAYTEQNGKTGYVHHRYVIRGRISAGVFGDQIATGAIAVNQMFTKNFSFNITRADWNKPMLRFLTVIWKKTGNDWNNWEFVNANSVPGTVPTGVAGLAAVDQLLVYPNPASDHIRISGALMVQSEVRLSLVNALGQIVHDEVLPYHDGQLARDISLQGLSNGVFSLLIRADGAQTIHKVVVSR